MNATTPVSSTENSRMPLHRGPVPFSWNATARPQATGLFEQLLSFSAPPVREPSSTDSASPRPDSSSETLHHKSQDDIAASGKLDELPREDDEETPYVAAEAVAAQAAVQPVAAPESPDSNLQSSELVQASAELTDTRVEVEASSAEGSSIVKPTDETTSAAVEMAATRENPLELASDMVAKGDTERTEHSDQLALAAEVDAAKTDAELPASDQEVSEKDAFTVQLDTDSQATAENDQETNHRQNTDEPLAVQAPADGEQGQTEDDARRGQRSTRGQRSKWYERDAQENIRGSDAAQDKPYVEKEQWIALESDSAALPGLQAIGAEQSASGDATANPESIPTITEPPLPSPTPLARGMVSETSPLQATAATVAAHSDGEIAGTSSTTSASHRHDVSVSSAAGSEHRSGPAARGANGEPQTSGLSQQEQVRLIQRVARSFNRLGPMGGEVNLRLHPPELGSLNVQVRLEGRSLTAKLTTENGAAREVILENLPVLKSRLAEQGVEVALFQVEVADNGNADAGLGDGNQQAFERQQQGERQPTQYQPPVHRFVGNVSPPDDMTDESTHRIWPNGSSRGIDVHA